MSDEPAAAYFSAPATWRYVAENLALWTDHRLPGVFAALPYPYSVNASLWTLPIEVTMYALTLVAVPFYARTGRAGQLAVALTALVVAALWDRNPYALRPLFDLPLYSFRLYDALGYMPSYMLASACAAARLDRAGPAARRWTIAASSLAIALLVVVPHRLPLTLLAVPMTAATLGVGLGDALDLRLVRRVGDVSYGTYLWGFLIQQLVMRRFGIADPWADLALSLPLAWLAGFVSWRLVERPALLLKPRSRAAQPPPSGDPAPI